MTLNDVIALIACVISPNTIASEAHYVKVVSDRPTPIPSAAEM